MVNKDRLDNPEWTNPFVCGEWEVELDCGRSSPPGDPSGLRGPLHSRWNAARPPKNICDNLYRAVGPTKAEEIIGDWRKHGTGTCSFPRIDTADLRLSLS